jgi:hypothetical protein
MKKQIETRGETKMVEIETINTEDKMEEFKEK